MAADGAQEARVHATGAETWGTAADGAQEARAHAMGAEMRGMATDGARDGAKTRGTQRGGAWARVRGVDAARHVRQQCAPQGAQAARGACTKATDKGSTAHRGSSQW